MAEEEKPVFGDTQAIRWARKKFSGPALAVIGTLTLAFGGYVATMESRMRAIEAALHDLQHDMPKGDYGAAAMRDDLSQVRTGVAVLTQRIDGQGEALQRIYERFDLDYIDGMAPLSKRKRK